MNLVLESPECVPFYTDMRSTLTAMGVEATAYDWFVSDVETNIAVPALADGDVWVTGDELSRMLSHDIQFIWGVFSAVPRGTRFEVLVPPGADGNPSFWQPPAVRPQLEGACLEIVCWDSSATVLVGVSSVQAERFLATYPDALPLSSTWPKANA
jgi:hypothetical protein